MSIVYLILAFCMYKYLPIVKNKINSIYQEKFNIVIFSKENAKKPFISSLLILFGKLYMEKDKISGMILIICGIAIMIYVIYQTYQKTDLVYGTIAGGLYLLLLGLQILFGLMMIALAMMMIVMLAMSNRNDRSYPL